VDGNDMGPEKCGGNVMVPYRRLEGKSACALSGWEREVEETSGKIMCLTAATLWV